MGKAALLTFALSFLLAGCVPRLQGVSENVAPSPYDWNPHPAPVEWWYVSAYLPQEGLAFHWAFFKFYAPAGQKVAGMPARALMPYPFASVHLAITDLRSDKFTVYQKTDFPGLTGRFAADPLRLELQGCRFAQQRRAFKLDCEPLQLTLTPEKAPVAHPPGWSGTSETGRMYYISYTRARLQGRIAGRKVNGVAWIDHQWGEQMSGVSALWDWYGLHLSNGVDLMLYRIRDAEGRVKVLQGSSVSLSGVARRLEGLTMTPLSSWTSPHSHIKYSLAWRVEGRGWSLTLLPLRRDQEIRGSVLPVAYWEGPVAGEGTWRGQPVKAWGMGEFVGGGFHKR